MNLNENDIEMIELMNKVRATAEALQIAGVDNLGTTFINCNTVSLQIEAHQWPVFLEECRRLFEMLEEYNKCIVARDLLKTYK